VYLDVNNLDGAKRTNKELRKLRPDGMTDCRACSLALDGSYYESLRQWKKQLEAIAPVLKGRYACNSQPLGSASRALRTLLRLGRRDEAVALQKQTVSRLKNQQNHSKHAARHVEFLALVGDTTGAKRIWVRFLPESLSSVSLDDRQFILRAGIVLLDRLLGLEQATTIRIPAHPDLPPPNAKGAHEIPTLREWMWNDALRIAALFDARNGNDGEAQKTLELPRLIKKLAAT
jgi:hypothetical protein